MRKHRDRVLPDLQPARNQGMKRRASVALRSFVHGPRFLCWSLQTREASRVDASVSTRPQPATG